MNGLLSAQAILDRMVQPDWRVALAIAAVIALLAKSARFLTVSGAVAAFAIGFITLGLGGGKFTVPLLTFFVTSSLLSRMGRGRKSGANAQTERGATRDHVQVLANGGAAAVVVVVFWLMVHRWPVELTRTLLMLYLAALATVNADTWATEIGGLSHIAPRLLSNWRVAPTGASGAVTVLGLAASAVGSLVVTTAGWLVWRLSPAEFVAVAWAGFLGSFVDSLLGASVQALYRHPATAELTERTIVDGVRTVKVRGISWINNDVVNFLASAGGILCAWILLRYCAYSVR